MKKPFALLILGLSGWASAAPPESIVRDAIAKLERQNLLAMQIATYKVNQYAPASMGDLIVTASFLADVRAAGSGAGGWSGYVEAFNDSIRNLRAALGRLPSQRSGGFSRASMDSVRLQLEGLVDGQAQVKDRLDSAIERLNLLDKGREENLLPKFLVGGAGLAIGTAVLLLTNGL